MRERIQTWRNKVRKFLRANGGNVAMMFGLSLIPITIAAGAGVDLARAMAVKSSMADALDSAALAVGATPGLSVSAATALAQQYFNANFKPDSAADTVPNISVAINGQSVTITASDAMPTTVLKAAGKVLNSASLQSINVTASTSVVWGQTKLWVSLVLDNTGSMDESDSGGTKMDALKSASHQLLTLLQGASSSAGDVRVAIVPFSKDVKVSTSNVGASWIDWTDWEAPPSSVPAFNVGPGSTCPWTSSSNGYSCVDQPSGTNTVGNIPSSGTYKGYICPTMDNGNADTGRTHHYYNGCYKSTASTTPTVICSGRNSCSCSGFSSCSCTGSNSNKVCTSSSGYSHTWVINAHSTWGGCLMDRAQNYDTTNTAPSSGSQFPAENTDYCPPATVLSLGYDWTALSNEVDSMDSNGNTNQTIGLDHGMMSLVSSLPYSAPSLPASTKEYIILLSDGANTQNRWGDNTSSAIDNRMALACTNAKAAGLIIYTIFLDIGGASGNSSVLQNCATDSSKFFDLTTTGSVSTTFAAIGQQITSLRVSQ